MLLAFLVVCQCLLGTLWVLMQQRDNFQSGHVQFIHNFKEGMIIMPSGVFDQIKLINKAASQMLHLPFVEDNSDNSELERSLTELKFVPIVLGERILQVNNSGQIDSEPVSLTLIVRNSLEGSQATDSMIYRLKTSASNNS